INAYSISSSDAAPPPPVGGARTGRGRTGCGCTRYGYTSRRRAGASMSIWTRRDWLKLTASGSGALLLPNVTGLLASGDQAPAARPAAGPALGRERLLA